MLTKGQVIRRLDARALDLKDDLMRYWEFAGITEAERDRCVNAIARLFDELRAASIRRSLAPASESTESRP